MHAVAMSGVVVLGGSVAGLATAVLLARDGHDVTVVERDRLEAGSPDASPGWERRGIPHFLQPHALIPRARSELRALLPDVYESLLAAGAGEVDVRAKLPGGGAAEDELQYLAARRPLLEWGLRTAAAAEPRVSVRDGTVVTGLVHEGGRMAGVRVGDAVVEADAVVDAMGRRTPTPAWLGEEPPDSTDCGVVYYSRYYRWRDGAEIPDGPWLLSPRGDLGYFGFASFPGDNRTFAALLAVPSGVPEWRAFAATAAFEAAVARIPMLRRWVDPDNVEPLTGMMPMAGLRNTLRRFDAGSAVGLFPVGDAWSHTDPVLAHGVAFAFIHARSVRDALRDHGDVGDAGAAYVAATRPALEERFRLATELDHQRHRMWTGEAVDFTRHDGDYALFTLVAGAAVAMVDPDVFRLTVRRIGLLDSTAVLDDDAAMQRRIEERFAELRSMPRPPAGPSRDEMVSIVAEATSG